MKPTLTLFLALASVIATAQSLSLKQSLVQAKTRRPAVKAATLQLERARQSRRALATLPGPSLLIGTSSDVQVGATDDDLVISQPLDLFGRTTANRRSGDAQVLQAEAELRQVELALQADVIAGYIDSVAATARLQASLQAEQSAQQLLEAIRNLVEGGKLPGVQASRIAIEVERATAMRKQREVDVKASRLRFSATIAYKDAIALSDFPEIAAPSPSDEVLTQQRSELLLLRAEVDAARAEARIAKAARMPQLEVQLRRSPWQQEAVYGARIQLSVPLLDFGKSRSEVTSADRRADAARENFNDAASIARAEVEAAQIEVAGSVTQVQALRAIAVQTAELVERTQTGLTEGANTLIDVLDARRALREVQEDLVSAQVALATAEAKFLQATGTLLEVPA